MNAADHQAVAITGIGMVTPLGQHPEEVLRRVEAGERAAAAPTQFDVTGFACPLCAEVKEFDPELYLTESKLVRLMSRDAQLAAAAARLALQHAGVKPGATYRPEDIALFGATGLAGLPWREVSPLLRASTGSDGQFDLERFGRAGLKAVRPVLSFKILSNMPLCFVSINENIQGPNSIYTPWEGSGAQAILAGIRAISCGDARCALVGGCDVKTHELAFASLEQQGLFTAWRESGSGFVPGEGAAFLVLETEADAAVRGARVHSRVSGSSVRAAGKRDALDQVRADILRALGALGDVGAVVSSANGDRRADGQELSALSSARVSADGVIRPKQHLGELFAAAALVQLGLGAMLTARGLGRVLVNCFGYGSTQAAFLLEGV